MGAYDGYKYAKKKNLKGWKKGAAVVGGALLGSINPFKVVKAAKTGYKAYKTSKYTKKAVSSAKKTKSVKKASTKAKSTVVTKKTAKKTTTAKSTKKTTQTVKKQTKQVTSSAKPVIHIKEPDINKNLDIMLMCHKETHKRLIDSSLLFRKFCFRTFFFNADML